MLPTKRQSKMTPSMPAEATFQVEFKASTASHRSKSCCARASSRTERLRLTIATCAAGLFFFFAFAWSNSWAFDLEGYKSKAQATLTELNAKKLPDSNATLARLDEMITIGTAAIKEYAARDPKYARLMDAAIADAQAMKGMTDAQLEEKWGEKGTGGDAVGIPLRTLGETSAPRTYLELIVAPAEQYVYIKRWQSVKKSRLLEQARDEAVELNKRLESFQME